MTLVALLLAAVISVTPSAVGAAASPLGAEREVTPRAAWEYRLPRGELPLSIEPDRRGRPWLYLALQAGGLSVLDVSGAEPREAARMPTGRFEGLAPTWITQRGQVLYVALGNFFDARGAKAGLAAVDVEDPGDPELLSIWVSDRKLRGAAVVLVDGETAYLGGMAEGIFILDVSDPARIELLSSILPDVDFPRPDPNRRQHPNARGLAIRDDLLYVAYDAGGLRVLDVTDRRNPREIGRYINPEIPNKPQAYNNLTIDWPWAYVAVDYCGMEILDLRDPGEIRQVGWWNPWRCDSLFNVWFNSDGHTNQLAVEPQRDLVYLSAGDSELAVVDVSDPARPRRVDEDDGRDHDGRTVGDHHAGYGEPGNGLGTWGLALTDEFVYLAYIETPIPFRGTWSGIVALPREASRRSSR